MDVFSDLKRSEVMAKIRGKGNKSTERRMVALLVAHGIRGWRLQPSNVVGRPDIYFPRLRIAIFVDGCFWHGCGQCYQVPDRNKAFWERKVVANKKRDRSVTQELKRSGVTVVRLWEHDLKKRTGKAASVLEMLGGRGRWRHRR